MFVLTFFIVLYVLAHATDISLSMSQNSMSCLVEMYTNLKLKLFSRAAAGLRNRSKENKALIMSEVEKNVWPAIATGKVKPVVYKSLPLANAAEGHRLMESSQHIGKILLVV